MEPQSRTPAPTGPRTTHSPTCSVLAIAGSLLLGAGAWALDIELTYDPTLPGAVDPCEPEIIDGVEVPRYAACRGPGNTFDDKTPALTATFEATAAYWEAITEDNHTLQLRYAWLAPAQGAPDALVLQRDGSGRPTEARVRISANIAYFIDAAPHNDDGFPMRPRLYRTMHPAEQAEALSGAPPEVLEVGYAGFGTDFDLWSIVMHEVSHALGMSGVDIGTCDPGADPYFHVSPGLTGGVLLGIKGYEFDITDDDGAVTGTAIDCNHLALGGTQECKPPELADQPVAKIFDEPSTLGGFTVGQCASHQALLFQGRFPNARHKPSIVDILAVELAGNWQQINLPRKYSLAGGNWHTAANWFGDRTPDASTDTYIVNQLPMFFVTDIQIGANAVTRNLYLSDENRVQVTGATLQVWDTLTAAGPNTLSGPLRPTPAPPDDGGPVEGTPGPVTTVRINAGGTVNAFDMVVENGARLELTAPGAVARIGELRSAGTIAGQGTVMIGASLQNQRLIFADGGTLTFVTPDADEVIGVPILDLDGPGFFGSSLASVRALEGNLVFDGIVASPVQAAVLVGPGRSVTFSNGWTQGFSGVAAHRLLLDGDGAPATVHGASTLGGRTRVQGLGVFTSGLSLQPTAELDLRIAGTVPGSDFDQVQIGQQAALGGTLQIGIGIGFQPAFGDSFELLTFASRVGQFDTVAIAGGEVAEAGGLTLTVHYQDTAVVLAVGLQGGEPGSPNCTGSTVSTQAGIHGSTQAAAAYHGFPSVKAYLDALKDFCG